MSRSAGSPAGPPLGDVGRPPVIERAYPVRGLLLGREGDQADRVDVRREHSDRVEPGSARGLDLQKIALFIAGAVVVVAAPVLAAVLAPAEIQSTFFTGQPFTASASGGKFKMVFTADGKMSREPMGAGDAKSEGTWKLSKEGFCTTWKGSKANCYRVESSGENKWSVKKGSQVVATWSK